MLFDRFYAFGGLLVLFLISRNIFLSLLVILLVVGLLIPLAAIPLLLWQSLVQMIAPMGLRALASLRWDQAFPKSFRAEQLRKRAVKQLKTAYGLSPDLFGEENKEPLRAILKRNWSMDAWVPPVFQRPLTARRLAEVLGAEAQFDEVELQQLGDYLEALAPSTPHAGWYLRLRWVRNVAMSYLVAPARDFESYGVLYLKWLRADADTEGAFTEFLGGSLRSRRLGAGLAAVTTPQMALRQIRPSAQRELIVVARLLNKETTLNRVRWTDPSRYRKMRELFGHFSLVPESLAGLRKAAGPSKQQTRQPNSQQEAPKPTPKTPEDIRSEIEAQATEAVYLKRMWPLGNGTPGNSHLGGLPSLPESVEWPRSKDMDQPLHFLAQIDCAEMPSVDTDTPLPDDGTLLFFADLDEEVIWDENSNATRVLFVPPEQQTSQKRGLPDGIPDIGHRRGRASGGYARFGVKTYPSWPIFGQTIRSFPLQQYENNLEYYYPGEELHVAELQSHLPPFEDSHRPNFVLSEVVRDLETGKATRDHDGKIIRRQIVSPSYDADESFPWCGAIMSAFADATKMKLQSKITEESHMLEYYHQKLAEGCDKYDYKESVVRARVNIEDQESRLKVARAFEPVLRSLADLEKPSPELSREIKGWMRDVMGRLDVNGDMYRAIKTVAQKAVTDAELRKSLPDCALETVNRDLRPSVKHSEHIFLGHPQVKTNSTAGNGIRLLVLDSDYGTDFMFCDCGVVEFYIQPADLAALDFSKAYALTAGG